MEEIAMKKILLATALVMTMGFAASAQYSDSYFKNWDNGINDRTGTISGVLPANPGGGIGDYTTDQPAPVGGGLLILTALGAGYAMARKRKK